MTTSEYAEYEAAVKHFFEREGGVRNLSPMGDQEGFFSWRPCECCQRSEGGERFQCNGYNPETKEILEYDVCIDCVYYAEYGQLDDTTMMDMKEG